MQVAGSSCAKAMEDKVFFDIGTNLVLGDGVRAGRVWGRGADLGSRIWGFGGLKNTHMFAYVRINSLMFA